jgi:hypothetical protein
MNRAERRAKARKRKGGCGASVSFGRHHSDIPVSPILEYTSKIGKDDHMKKVLRSKQVPGY